MNKKVNILIGNCKTWEAIELTIESILKRTAYGPYEIIVYDQSRETDNGSRLPYLRTQAEKGNIKLIEGTYRQRSDLDGHGKAIKELLKNCDADLALLWDSDIEVLHSSWLSILVSSLKGENVLGVGGFNPGRNHWDRMWIAPRYIPNWMLLDMAIYKDFQGEDDWGLDFIPFSKWKYPEVFEGQRPPNNPELLNGEIRVFRDTGWRIWEKLTFENPRRLKMLPLPVDWWGDKMRHFCGIDRNSFQPDLPELVEKLQTIRRRLELLRREP
jgi:hypothetical protein